MENSQGLIGQEDAVAVSQEKIGALANPWRRLGTLLIDYVGVLITGFIVGILIALISGRRGAAFVHDYRLLVGVMIVLVYYCFFEGIWQRTPGKMVLGTIVTTESGARPKFAAIIGRTLCRFIPFEAFSVFWTVGWHDRIPKTRVFMTKSLKKSVADQRADQVFQTSPYTK